MRINDQLNTKFKQKALVAAISSSLCVVAMAQEAAVTEEVLVTGIRGSLERAMDIKRESTGVVDAISAEDIGKFPDTNLAESLQRITGVSIDRQNGEGSKVTVRGFGPDFNLVSLNGRILPNTTGDRTFDFDNVAAELVSGVTVYKSNEASQAGGGIGATINLVTHRPLNSPGVKATISGKLVDDGTTRTGGITPELSGLYSNTFADDTIGISIAASYQEREYGLAQYNQTRGPRSSLVTNTGWAGVPAGAAGGVNRPTTGIYTNHNQPRYEFQENQRERLNGQLVLQFAPTDDFTATFDYTMVENTVETQHSDVSVWFNYAGDRSETIWEGEPNAYPLVYSEVYAAPDELAPEYPLGERWKDTSLTLGAWGIEETIDSFGMNLEWHVTDQLRLELDAHTSEANLEATDPRLGTRNNVQIPSFTRTLTGLDERGELPGIATGQIELFHPGTFQLSGSWFQNNRYTAEVDQIQIHGDYEFNDEWSIDFGAGNSVISNRFKFSQVQRGDWGGVGVSGDFANLDWTSQSVFDSFDETPSVFQGTPSEADYDLLDVVYWTDFKEFLDQAEVVDNIADNLGSNLAGDCVGQDGVLQPNLVGQFCASSDYDAHTNRFTEEDTNFVYAQLNINGEVAGFPTDVHLGVRYEQTDIYSESASTGYDPSTTVVAWREVTATSIEGSVGTVFLNKADEYDYLLPNLNINMEFSDDVKGRFAFGKTIARPDYGLLLGGTSVGSGGSASGYTGESGNPGLKPLESTNVDLAVEWYYDEGSYASLGYFRKDVKNWTSTGSQPSQLFNLPNPLDGQKFAEAEASEGSDLAAIRNYIFTNYASDPYVDVANQAIFGDPATDNPITFLVAVPVNADREETVDGIEFNVQHLFGETGFGAIFNYTMVDTGLEYDIDSLEDTEAIIGLSDTSNLVAFYDKDGIQARIAYNWRDRFLSSRRLDLDPDERHPMFTEPYSQIDISASYDIPALDGLTVFFEGIDITEESVKIVGRQDKITMTLTSAGARYNLGVRYTF